MAATATVYGLGLGNITISSHLGQPLNARIALLGSPSDLDPNCFKVVPTTGNASPLPDGISISLDQSGHHRGLKIQTRQAINDPALMFTLSVVCPESIKRDYALLLDPPVFREDLPVAASETAVMADKSSIGTTANQANGNARARRIPDSNAISAQHKKPSASKRGTKRVVRWPENDGPRLILTGSRRLFSPATAQLSLNLDVGLLDTTRRAEAPFNADELTDENTALMRKLAYLEDTLANLQKRNSELQQARAKALQGKLPSQVEPPKASANSTWPYLLAVMVLLTGAAAYVMYRRRRQSVTQYDESEVWHIPVASSGLSMPATDVEEKQLSNDPLHPSAAVVKVPVQQESSPISTFTPSDKKDGTEVKDSVADEVEVFVAHGHADLAIHMLEDHIEKSPDESPVPWLLLLDLLKREGVENKYDEYRLKCKTHFNVSMPSYGESEVHPTGHGLESYGHIMSELVRLWPSEQVKAYLDDLIYDRRGGSRMGFDPATYRDIVLLHSIRTSIS